MKNLDPAASGKEPVASGEFSGNPAVRASQPSGQGALIDLPRMTEIEGRVEKEAWIVAEDAVVDYLVLHHFSETTTANLRRGVNYRFLVSEAKAQEMEDFADKMRKEMANKAKPGQKPGRLAVHAVPDAVMKLTMPGCLFDPFDLTRAASYFRSCTTSGLSFSWLQLSPMQHTAYLEGFKFAWPPDPAECLAAAKILAPLAAALGLLLAAAAWLVTKITLFDTRKELVWAGLLWFSLWMASTWCLVHLNNRLRILRRTAEFRILQTALQILLGAILLGVAVNLLSDWLGSSP